MLSYFIKTCFPYYEEQAEYDAITLFLSTFGSRQIFLHTQIGCNSGKLIDIKKRQVISKLQDDDDNQLIEKILSIQYKSPSTFIIKTSENTYIIYRTQHLVYKSVNYSHEAIETNTNTNTKYFIQSRKYSKQRKGPKLKSITL